MSAAQAHDALKHLLLDMLSTTRPVEARLATLSAADWDIVCAMAQQHRLEPLLHHHGQTRGSEWAVPDAIRSRWAGSYRQATLRWLTISGAVRKLDSFVADLAIPYAALKGVWLARYAYSHPALRPMRDIDILVPADQIIATFEQMEAVGYRRQAGNLSPLRHALDHHKHLPPIICPATGVKIEVHARLLEYIPQGDFSETIADSDAVLSRRMQCDLPNDPISYLAPTDTLLHLIIHSAYEHRFDNGPVVMNDIAALLSTAEIDWDRFWHMAEKGGWTRGCQLVLAMTRYYHGSIVPEPATATAPIAPEIITAAALLTLIDFDERQAIALRKEMIARTGLFNLISSLYARAFPTRHILAAHGGLPLDSQWVWAQYPSWMAARLRQTVFRKLPGALQSDAKRAAQIEHWLRDPATAKR